METLTLVEDGVLAARAADGDERAFAVLVRRHSGYLIGFATRLLGSRADADDCVQEALIVAWRRLPELREPARVRSWLSTIVARKATDRLRSARPSTPIEDAEPEALQPTPDESAVASSQLDTLRRVLDDLPVEQRTVWLLREVSGYGYDEIARELGVSATAVRGRLARARATIYDRMQDWR
ncbi:RNA polymerase sigma factor [Microbacterium hominis]|uniref:RNA polymerase sigma factor n=1 Tax=Microbacterium hominis TaxID=162426 RepID=A0A134DDX5_9MICO|nr:MULTISPECIES: RNA polymerase sigma factor [Microbacterium]AUG30494.1 RNA polymerase sigma factor [Microbacterium hominis]KXC04743.1 RNA polymerase subunit sigma-70 [Microbacterium hominis]QOC26256.1 RNA polymerase sigma factor [Microbacterium hominis]QOC30210.1 RNA polymerase sigma factor [Microbacterium hominis]QRY41779.1 RNA polymerase sigma factor [Microbacterium hominis]